MTCASGCAPTPRTPPNKSTGVPPMSKASDELLKLLRAAHDDKTKTKNKEPGYRSRVNDCEELLDELIEREGCPLLNTPQIRRDVIDAVYETLGYASDGRLVRLDDSMNAKEVLLEYITPREYLHVPKAPPDIVGRATVGDENGVVTLAARAALLKDCGGDNPAGLAAYRQILAAHGCSENNLKPGKAPEIKTNATAKKFIHPTPPAQ